MTAQLLAFPLVTLFFVHAPMQETRPRESAAPAIEMNNLSAWLNRGEGANIEGMKESQPLADVYVQEIGPGAKPGTIEAVRDFYLLAKFQWRNGPSFEVLGPTPRVAADRTRASRRVNTRELAEGVVKLLVPDWTLLGPDRYDLTFVRREFVGEARCFVLDVRPRNGGRNGFRGRIYVEDVDWTIVKFNGTDDSEAAALAGFFRKKAPVYVEGWRTNIAPGVWVTSSVYFEQIDLDDRLGQRRVKGRIQLWGYATPPARSDDEFTRIDIDQPTFRDRSEDERHASPVQALRRQVWEAERNVLARLTLARLVAPEGDVDAVLNGVLHNLIVTNGLTFERKPKCRVLLLSPLEAFTVGNTIYVSKGLLDLLPGESALALVLAHQLAHIVKHSTVDTINSFASHLMVPDGDLVRALQFQHSMEAEAEADAMVVQILDRSPYNGKLDDAGLFLAAMTSPSGRRLEQLIAPTFGEHVADKTKVVRYSKIMRTIPDYAPGNLNQVSALALGGRVVIADPANGRIEMLRAPITAPTKPSENAALAVVPFAPYITYFRKTAQSAAAH